MNTAGNDLIFAIFILFMIASGVWLLFVMSSSIPIKDRMNERDELKRRYSNRKNRNISFSVYICIIILSLLCVWLLIMNLKNEFLYSLIAIILAVIFFAGVTLSVFTKVKLIENNNEDTSKKFKYFQTFTSIMILILDIYTFIWSR